MTESRTSRFLASAGRNPGLWALGVILISLVVRLWFVASGQLDLVQDEAQYWDWSRRFQLSYYSKGPLIAWVIDFWTSLFGDTELGVRMGAVVNATLAQIMLYFGIARLMRRPRLAVLALVVANTMPLFLACSVLMTTDNILMICWLGALLCLYALTGPDGPAPTARPRAAFFLLALCMAAGNLAKYMMLALFAVAVLHFWLLSRHNLLRRGLAVKTLAVMAVGSFLGYLPILVWNAQNGWIGLLHVGTLAGVTGSAASRIIRLDTVPEFLGAQLGVATPWWLLIMLFAGWRALRFAWTGKEPNESADALADNMTNAAAPSREERLRQSSLLACAFWPIWFGMFVWSFHTRIYPNWPGMCYVAGIILAATGLERLLAGQGNAVARRLAPVWIPLGAVLFTLVFAQNWLPLPAHLNPATRLKGWADLGNKLDELAQGLPNPAKVFYFGDNYDVTAELAFYAPGQPVAYSADFGRRRSQYDLWPDPTGRVWGQSSAQTAGGSAEQLPAVLPDSANGDKTGWDAFYVSTRGRTPEELYAMFDEVTTIPYISTHRGKPGREFTVVLLRNFNGRWPHTEYARY